jgi:hypothetical protein
MYSSPSVLLCLVAVAALLTACEQPQAPVVDDPDAFTIDATVRSGGPRGLCWTLKVENGSYQPVGLSEEFKVNELEVRAVVKRVPGGSVCMLGPFVEVLWIELRGLFRVAAAGTNDTSRHVP